MRLVLPLLCVFWLLGCVELDLELPDDERITLSIVEPGSGAPPTQCEIPQGAARRGVIADWVDGHREGWSRSYVTWVPVVYGRGESFSLNFMGDLVVATRNGRQYTLEVPAGSTPELACPPD